MWQERREVVSVGGVWRGAVEAAAVRTVGGIIFESADLIATVDVAEVCHLVLEREREKERKKERESE
jgi:hypothetical protein